MSENLDRYKKRSAWWFLLPIFFTIFGGLIAYFAIRSDDARRARDCLLLGAILFAIPIVVGVVMITFFSSQIPQYEQMLRPPIWEV